MPADVAVDASAGDGESAERRGWRRSSGNNSAEEQVCCSGKRDEGERQKEKEREGRGEGKVGGVRRGNLLYLLDRRRKRKEAEERKKVRWRFEPSQPHRVISG